MRASAWLGRLAACYALIARRWLHCALVLRAVLSPNLVLISYPAMPAVRHVSISPDGGNLYAVSFLDSAITVFLRSASTGQLTWLMHIADTTFTNREPALPAQSCSPLAPPFSRARLRGLRILVAPHNPFCSHIGNYGLTCCVVCPGCSEGGVRAVALCVRIGVW